MNPLLFMLIDGGIPLLPMETPYTTPEVLSNRPVSIVVVNKVMKEEQSVLRSRKRAASVKKRAILRLYADHQRRLNNSKETRMTVLTKAVCKWKLCL